MTDLGNIGARLRLQCKYCDWIPPENAVMEAVALHCQVDHDTSEIALDMVAVCSCGASMTLTESRPTGGGMKDYMGCPACGNTGHLIRRDTP